MRAIIVDDEPIMLKSFLRLSSDIEDLNVIGQFSDPIQAMEFAKDHTIDVAFLDVEMPVVDGIELAEKLRESRRDMLIVFISGHDEYIRAFNQIGADYYIAKPYRKQTLETAMEKIRLLAKGQRRDVQIRTFGKFTVLKNGQPVHLTGRAKEILALCVVARGREISNEEIYSTVWENRAYSNANMTVYYNALRRLRKALEKEGLSELLLSSGRGQMVDTDLFDCDYYDWLDNNEAKETKFAGEFLNEYSWGEYILGDMVTKENKI